MRITMKDIAQDCGVSRATVNQILGGYGHRFSDATCQRVNESARRLGFRVNASARAIRTGKFNCVSLVLQDVADLGGLPPGLLTGIDQRMAEHGKSLMVCHAPSSSTDQGRSSGLSTLVNQAMVDGHLIDTGFREPTPVKGLDSDGLPRIWLRCQRDHDCLSTDEYQAGYAATEHLLKLGHRKITFVHGKSELYFLHLRIKGYEQAMREAAVSPDLWVFPDRVYPEHPGRQVQQIEMFTHRLNDAAEWLASANARPTACVAASSNDALGVQSAALRSGLALPDDLSLITIGDFFVNPGFPITTMFTNLNRLGRKAGEMMLTKLEKPNEPLAPVVQGYELVEGITTAAKSD